MKHWKLLVLLILLLVPMASAPAHALPAFARRYNVDCITCHTVPPRLNNFGEAFMRRGFKMQWDEKLEGQKLQDYLSTQTNLDYVATNPVDPGTPASTLNDTQVAFLTAGPMSPQLSWYGELDYDPLATDMSVHELKALVFWPTKITDDKEHYYSLQFGAIRPFSTWQKELTEARTVEAPMIFDLVPQGGFSFVTDNPQYGAELSYNVGRLTGTPSSTYVTAAVLEGLNVNLGGGPNGLTPNQNGSADYQLQIAHYWGLRNSVSLMYYNGSIKFNALDVPGGDPTQFPFLQGAGTVTDRYSRVFLNGNWSPNLYLDFVGGLMVGNDSANPVDGTAAASNGGYVEANYYFNPKSHGYPKWVLMGRYDTMDLAAGTQGQSQNDVVFALTGQVWKNIFLTLERSETNNGDGSHTGTTIGDIRFIW